MSNTPHNQPLNESAELKENITIRLQGTTTTDSVVDLSLTGIGKLFTASQIVDEDRFLNCQYEVTETETDYRVVYHITERIKVPTKSGPDTMNYQYHDVSISGTVICVAGRPVVLVKNGSKPLQLTITKAALPGADGE